MCVRVCVYLRNSFSYKHILLKMINQDSVISFLSAFLFGERDITIVFVRSLKTVQSFCYCILSTGTYDHLRSFFEHVGAAAL